MMTQSQFVALSPEVQAALTAQGIVPVPDGSQQSPAPAQAVSNIAGWNKPQASSSALNVESVSVPISIFKSGKGWLNLYINFSPAILASADTLFASIEAMESQLNLPLSWKGNDKGSGSGFKR